MVLHQGRIERSVSGAQHDNNMAERPKGENLFAHPAILSTPTVTVLT